MPVLLHSYTYYYQDETTGEYTELTKSNDKDIMESLEGLIHDPEWK